MYTKSGICAANNLIKRVSPLVGVYENFFHLFGAFVLRIAVCMRLYYIKVLKKKHNLYNDFRVQVIRMLPLEKRTCFFFLCQKKRKRKNLLCGKTDFLSDAWRFSYIVHTRSMRRYMKMHCIILCTSWDMHGSRMLERMKEKLCDLSQELFYRRHLWTSC